MVELLNIPNENSNVIDTPEEGAEQHRKRESLIELINQGKAHRLPGKSTWTVKRLDKASDGVIEKLFNENKQKELQEKGEKTGKAIGKQVIKLYSNGIEKFINIDSQDNLQKDVEEDIVIKDSLADIGELMVSTFGKFLSPLLLLCHTANHVQYPILKSKICSENSVESEDPAL